MTTWIIAALIFVLFVQHRRIRRLNERLDDTRRENHVFQYETFERLHKAESDFKRLTEQTEPTPTSTSRGNGPQVFDV